MSMDASEYAKIINEITVLKGLSSKHIEKIISASILSTYKQDELALKTAGPGDEILFVLKGRLAVISSDGETLALIDSGQCVGEMAVFTNRKRSADVKAVLETEVLKLHKDNLFKFVEEDPAAGVILYRNVIEVLSRHMEKNNLLMEFSHILEG